MSMERELIDWLRKRVPPDPRLPLGLDDDAALVKSSRDVVVTVDALMDGVDFDLTLVDARRAGRKALAVNLSDLAAMAARPTVALVSLVLPRHDGLELARQLFEGLLPLAERHAVGIAGGDVNSWDGRLAISVTAMGEPTSRGVWTRGGARPGDWIVVTGSFGGSLLGRHLDFEPRVNEALLLAERYEIHAATDVSDGLGLDLSHVAESSGVGFVLELAAVPVAADAIALAQSDGRAPLDHALADGEDFELILALSPDEAQRLLRDQPLDIPLTRIGQFTADGGFVQVAADGARAPFAPRGWEHG